MTLVHMYNLSIKFLKNTAIFPSIARRSFLNKNCLNKDRVSLYRTMAFIMGMISFIATGCGDNGDNNREGGHSSNEIRKSKNSIVFALSADYPPFEFYDKDELSGFDVELAKMIGSKLGRNVEFRNVAFASIFPSVSGGSVDAAISSIVITKEREKNFDFSRQYYTDRIAILHSKDAKIDNMSDFRNHSILCQLGTSMEIWLRRYIDRNPSNAITIKLIDSNLQGVEALKSGSAYGVIMNLKQAKEFAKANEKLSYMIPENVDMADDEAYGVLLKKGSPLLADINRALDEIEKEGELKKLKSKYDLD